MMMPTIDYIDREKRMVAFSPNIIPVTQPDADKINGITIQLQGDVTGQKTFDGTDTLKINTTVRALTEQEILDLLEV